ncbi:MAG: initiation factor 2 [Erysipelotrichaceae bacterium]
MYKKEDIRELLPKVAREKFDDIVLSRVLGANAHIKLIGEILIDISNDSFINSDVMLENIGLVANFFKETRGQQSRAIYNAINRFTCGFDKLKLSNKEEIINTVYKQISNYEKFAKEDIDTLVSYGVNLCENMTKIMVFDYSSTVNAFLKVLPANIEIYIPESRALDGGRPFVATAVEAGHIVHFIPDTTMMSALKECQAAFMGAETIYPDGTVFNTIGSDVLSVICEYLKKPLYVLTPLIKVDTRPTKGYVRLSSMPFDYGDRLASHWDSDIRSKVDFSGFKLLEINANKITSFITEKGIIPPASLYYISMEYASNLEGNDKNEY